MTGRIRIEIDRIVLHGTEPVDRERLGASVEAELARLLRGGPLHGGEGASRRGGTRAAATPATAPDPAADPTAAVASRIARAAYDRVTRP